MANAVRTKKRLLRILEVELPDLGRILMTSSVLMEAEFTG